MIYESHVKFIDCNYNYENIISKNVTTICCLSFSLVPLAVASVTEPGNNVIRVVGYLYDINLTSKSNVAHIIKISVMMVARAGTH